jgi:hypothetical protein
MESKKHTSIHFTFDWTCVLSLALIAIPNFEVSSLDHMGKINSLRQ